MILCIVGPTGVGKTKLSIALAKKYNALIINADSMQVYKELNIGTAKPSMEERAGITHELMDFLPVDADYTVFDYQRDARKILHANANRNIIFVGGTGLYLKATLFDYDLKAETKVFNDYANLTNKELYDLALKKDATMDIHPNNRQRLIRFLNKENTSKREPKELYKAIYIGLTTDRKNLYDRINSRVDDMLKNGLMDEVANFYKKGIVSKAINQGIGYKELYAYFDNKISLSEAIELIKKRSRNYAKRQYTWFNNQLPVKWFTTNYEDFNATINEISTYIEKGN